MGWFDDAGNGKRVDVHALLDNDSPDVLWELVGLGAMISVSLTSDGGAMGVTVTLNGKWRREYFRDDQDLAVWLKEALDAVTTAIAEQSASPGQRSRYRGRRAP